MVVGVDTRDRFAALLLLLLFAPGGLSFRRRLLATLFLFGALDAAEAGAADCCCCVAPPGCDANGATADGEGEPGTAGLTGLKPEPFRVRRTGLFDELSAGLVVRPPIDDTTLCCNWATRGVWAWLSGGIGTLFRTTVDMFGFSGSSFRQLRTRSFARFWRATSEVFRRRSLITFPSRVFCNAKNLVQLFSFPVWRAGEGNDANCHRVFHRILYVKPKRTSKSSRRMGNSSKTDIHSRTATISTTWNQVTFC